MDQNAWTGQKTNAHRAGPATKKYTKDAMLDMHKMFQKPDGFPHYQGMVRDHPQWPAWSSHWNDEPSGDVGRRNRPFGEHPTQPVPAPAPSVPTQPAKESDQKDWDQEIWFYKADSKETEVHGPFAFQKIRDWMADGFFVESELRVRRKDEKEWKQVDDLVKMGPRPAIPLKPEPLEKPTEDVAKAPSSPNSAYKAPGAESPKGIGFPSGRVGNNPWTATPSDSISAWPPRSPTSSDRQATSQPAVPFGPPATPAPAIVPTNPPAPLGQTAPATQVKVYPPQPTTPPAAPQQSFPTPTEQSGAPMLRMQGGTGGISVADLQRGTQPQQQNQQAQNAESGAAIATLRGGNSGISVAQLAQLVDGKKHDEPTGNAAGQQQLYTTPPGTPPMAPLGMVTPPQGGMVLQPPSPNLAPGGPTLPTAPGGAIFAALPSVAPAADVDFMSLNPTGAAKTQQAATGAWGKPVAQQNAPSLRDIQQQQQQQTQPVFATTETRKVQQQIVPQSVVSPVLDDEAAAAAAAQIFQSSIANDPWTSKMIEKVDEKPATKKKKKKKSDKADAGDASPTAPQPTTQQQPTMSYAQQVGSGSPKAAQSPPKHAIPGAPVDAPPAAPPSQPFHGAPTPKPNAPYQQPVAKPKQEKAAGNPWGKTAGNKAPTFAQIQAEQERQTAKELAEKEKQEEFARIQQEIADQEKKEASWVATAADRPSLADIQKEQQAEPQPQPTKSKKKKATAEPKKAAAASPKGVWAGTTTAATPATATPAAATQQQQQQGNDDEFWTTETQEAAPVSPVATSLTQAEYPSLQSAASGGGHKSSGGGAQSGYAAAAISGKKGGGAHSPSSRGGTPVNQAGLDESEFPSLGSSSTASTQPTKKKEKNKKKDQKKQQQQQQQPSDNQAAEGKYAQWTKEKLRSLKKKNCDEDSIVACLAAATGPDEVHQFCAQSLGTGSNVVQFAEEYNQKHFPGEVGTHPQRGGKKAKKKGQKMNNLLNFSIERPIVPED